MIYHLFIIINITRTIIYDLSPFFSFIQFGILLRFSLSFRASFTFLFTNFFLFLFVCCVALLYSKTTIPVDGVNEDNNDEEYDAHFN